MQPEQLEKHEIRTLRRELVQLLLMLLVQLIMASAVAFALIAYLEDNNIPHARLAVISLFLTIYIAVLIVVVRPRIREISRGMKGTIVGTIINKRQSDMYLPGAGINGFFYKPKHVNYYFLVDSQEIAVDRTFFEHFNTHDQIKIHYSLRNGNIINITKLE